MKITNTLFAAGLMGLAAAAANAQSIPALTSLPNGTTSNGDLVLGFSNPNSTTELLVNVGPASDYYSTTNGYASENTTQGGSALTPGVTYNVAAYNSADLTTVFGTTGAGAAYSGNTVFGVVGGDGGAHPVSGAESQDTNWLTGVAAQTAGTKSSQSILSADLKTMTADMVNQSQTGLASPDAISESTSVNPSFTQLMGTGDFNTGVNVVTAVGTTGTTSLELYELIPTNGTPAAPGGLNSVDLGTFALSSSGLTFTPFGAAIPEPSAYAAILGVLTIGFVMIRRRVQSSGRDARFGFARLA